MDVGNDGLKDHACEIRTVVHPCPAGTIPLAWSGVLSYLIRYREVLVGVLPH